MANQIRLKRASGSDPSASDLVLGEPAVRTDTGELFFLKDNGNVAKVSGGGISDGDKGDITVSNSGDTFTIDNGVISTAKIADNAVELTKIQDILTTRIIGRSSSGTGNPQQLTASDVRSIINVEDGATADQSASEILTLLKTVDGSGSGLDADTLDGISSASFVRSDTADTMTGNLTISNTGPKLILTDTDNNSDFRIKVQSGSFVIEDTTNNNDDRLSITSSGVLTTNACPALDGTAGSINITGGTSGGRIAVQGTTTSATTGIGEQFYFWGTNKVAGLIAKSGTDTSNKDDGSLHFYTSNAGPSVTERLVINADGHIDVAGNLDVGAGIDVTGNITVTGTVDGVDIAARNTLFGGLTSSSGVLTNGVTATTQSAGDNSTKVATTAYTDTAISNLVDSAPGTLNTLNELAAALGDDANFSTTVTNSIATKMPLAGGTFTGNITLQNDAPKIFLTDSSNNPDFSLQNANGAFVIFDDTNSAVRIEVNADGHVDIKGNLDCESGIDVTGAITATGNASVGETLTITGANPNITFTDSNNNPDFKIYGSNGAFSILDSTNSANRFVINSSGAVTIGGNLSVSGASNSFGNTTINGSGGAGGIAFTIDYNGTDVFKVNNVGSVTVNGTVDGRDVASDGSKLDGIAASATNNGSGNAITDGDKGDITVSNSGGTFTIDNDVVTTAKMINFPTQTILGRETAGTGNATTLNASQVRSIINVENGATADQSASEILTLIKTVDGSGSGLDADTLDGVNGANFVRTNQNTTITSDLFIGGGAGGLTINAASDIRFANGDWTGNVNGTAKIQHHSNYLYISGGTNGIIFRENNGDRWIIDPSGHFDPGADSTYDIGESGKRVRNGYFDNLYGNGANITNVNATTLDSIDSGSFLRSDTDDTFAGNLTVDDGTDTILSVKCDNGGFALVRANGDGQGTGAVEVGQSNTYGGGIAYNGDGSPSFADGESADHIMFYRLDNGTRTEVFHYPYNSNTVNFNSTPTVGGVSLVRTNDTIAQASNASTLDSLDSSQFARSDTDDTLAGIYTLTNTNRDCFNFSGNSTDDNRGIAFNGRIAISADYNDGYLRLNNASEFGNGVYTPLVMRADNGFQVDGTTVINGSAQLIASRLTGALPAIDGSALTGISAGATGGGSDEVFYENGQTVTTSYTITNGKNAMAAGPITINNGVTVTVGSGENLTIV